MIVVDAEDRENEGDYICAAEKATPETVNFMLTGRGQLCVSILPDVSKRLDLSPVVAQNDAPLKTAFLTPIDIHDRQNGDHGDRAKRDDPATCDLPIASRRTLFVPVTFFRCWPSKGASCGVPGIPRRRRSGPDGGAAPRRRAVRRFWTNRATGPHVMDWSAIAKQRNLKIISIEQLIAHRRVSEKLINRAAEARLPTKFGDFRIIVYGVQYEAQEPIAIGLWGSCRPQVPHRWCGCTAVVSPVI